MTIINSVIKGKQPVIDTLNVTPTTSPQQITAPQGTDGYSPVNVTAVTSSIDANIVAGNIKKDVEILGVTGSYEGIVPTGTLNIPANDTYDVTNYASVVVNVPTTAPSRYLEYDLDANGQLIHDKTVSSIINLNGVTDIGDYILARAYYQNTNITGALDLSGLTQITGAYGCTDSFRGCTGITSVDLSNLIKISGNSVCYDMFMSCTGITNIDLTSLKIVSGNSSCTYMFQGCTGITTADLRSLTAITNNQGCSGMFQRCTGITSINLSNLITISGNSGCYEIFAGCSNLPTADLSSLILANGTSACYIMFANCTNLTSVNLSHLCKLSANTAFQRTFQGCTSLTSLSFPNLAYTETNLNNTFNGTLQGVTGCTVHFPAEWQTTMSSWSNITNGLGGTNTTVLFDLPNVTTLDLSHITEISGFSLSYLASSNYFPNITDVDLSSLTIVNEVNGCYAMFQNCTGITSVDLSSLREASASNAFFSAFQGCTSLTTVDLSSLETVIGTSVFSNTFANCTSLTTLSFPALKTISNALVFGNMLSGVTGCAVHFPSNLSGSGIASYNIGGSNTVLYDLPATNILTGADTVEYERNPKFDTATALAWRVNDTMPDTTTYYTSGTTDPQVGDTIYSDSACTVAVTTISSIA